MPVRPVLALAFLAAAAASDLHADRWTQPGYVVNLTWDKQANIAVITDSTYDSRIEACLNHPDTTSETGWVDKCYYHYFHSRSAEEARHATTLYETLRDRNFNVSLLLDEGTDFFVSIWQGNGAPPRPLTPDDRGKPLAIRTLPGTSRPQAAGAVDLLGRSRVGLAAGVSVPAPARR